MLNLSRSFNLRNITISIVSHNQDLMLITLLDKLAHYSTNISKVIVTHNTTKQNILSKKSFPFEVFTIHNKKPKGFGANHNQAFQFCDSDFFCVMNPDIDLKCEPFKALTACFNDSLVCIVSPLIKNPNGNIEDSARYFPTPWGIFKKVFFNYRGVYPINKNVDITYPDWIGGMFLLFESKKYKALSGFDEKYHLYYEDVDICLRAWKSKYKVLLYSDINVIHDARRSSHKNLIYLKWHLASLMLFFIKHIGRFPIKAV